MHNFFLFISNDVCLSARCCIISYTLRKDVKVNLETYMFSLTSYYETSYANNLLQIN